VDEIMKQILILLILGFALSLCNLTNKLKKTGYSSSDGKSTSTAANAGGATVEHAEPTAAQMAALAGGETVKWDKQGMSWTMPPKWTQTTDETKMLVWRSPGTWNAASLIVNISTMDESFPTEISLKAFYDGAKTRAKNGEVDELKWLEIDGVKGVEFREANPEKPDDQRRLQWIAYRKYAGQVQMVNLMLATLGKDFAQHQDAMYAILYSTKLVH
jgi:hypothetical protein